MTSSTGQAVTSFSPRERRALRAVAVQFFVNGALFASFIPRLPEIRDRVGLSVTEVGLLVSLAGAAGLASSAVVGRIVGRLGTRRVILVGGSLVPASLVVVGLATNPWLLLLGLAGMSAFDVLVDVAMNMQGSWLSGRRPVPVINRLHGLWSLGTLVGGASAARLASAGVPIRLHLVGAALVLLATLAYVVPGLLSSDDPPPPIPSGEKPTDHDVAATQPEAKQGDNRGVVSARNVLWLFGLAGLFSVTLESTSLDWAAFRLTDDLDATPGLAALGYVAVAGGMTVARLIGDWLVARLGEERHASWSLGLTAAGLVLAIIPSTTVLVLAGFALLGLGNAALMPALYDRAAKAPGRPGAGLGALTAGIRVAILSVPLLVGALAGTSLSVAAAIAAVTGPSLIGFYFITRRTAL